MVISSIVAKTGTDHKRPQTTAKHQQMTTDTTHYQITTTNYHRQPNTTTNNLKRPANDQKLPLMTTNHHQTTTIKKKKNKTFLNSNYLADFKNEGIEENRQ